MNPMAPASPSSIGVGHGISSEMAGALVRRYYDSGNSVARAALCPEWKQSNTDGRPDTLPP